MNEREDMGVEIVVLSDRSNKASLVRSRDDGCRLIAGKTDIEVNSRQQQEVWG